MQAHIPTLLSTLLLSVGLQAQESVLPDLSGEELIEALSEAYYPERLLSLSQVKDTLYSVIDIGSDDSLRCIYSDRAVYVPKGVDPSQTVFMNGDGINLEHLWPQSKGAGDGTAGQTDMYHLVPSRVDINSMRANNPFSESADDLTDMWYYLNYSEMSIPNEMIEVYSEADELRFEPREDRKGDIARALFYFYSIHNADADQSFFDQQLSTLCSWHIADPVDDRELIRAERIKAYQGNTNPFLLDCTLPSRAFCGPEYNCTTSTGLSSQGVLAYDVTAHGCQIRIECRVREQGILHFNLYSLDGMVHDIHKRYIARGSNEIVFSSCDLPSGLYILTAVLEKDGVHYRAKPGKIILH